MRSLARRLRKKGTTPVDNAMSSPISGTDVLFEILSRLPLKSLLVFKSVSKQWLSIITDPEFIRKKHCIGNGRLKIPGMFLKKDSCDFKNREYNYIRIDGNVSSTFVPFKTLNFAGEDKRIIQSCNGLLLCTNWDGGYRADMQYYIYNPFTKQYKILPPFNPPAYTTNSWCLLRSLSDIKLAFDPLNSLSYKVICFWGNHGGTLTKRIEIYSSETSSWRLCKEAYTFPKLYYKSCVLWNGSLNWITSEGSLIYFDIDSEALGEVLSPREKHCRSYTNGNCLDVYGGHLLLLLSNLDISTCFDVFEMDTNYTDWILKYKVDMEGLKGSYPALGDSCSNYKVIFIDEVEEYSPKFIVLIRDSQVIFSYDSEKNSFTELYDLYDEHEWKYSPKWSPSPEVYKYVESLACV